MKRMRPAWWSSTRTWFIGLAFYCIAVGAAVAQPTPRLGYVYPAGGKQGSTFNVAIGGQFLAGVTNVSWSGDGIKAVILEHDRPLTPREFNLLRDRLTELQEKRSAAMRNRQGGSRGTNAPVAFTAADEKQVMEIRRRIANYGARRLVAPALAEIVRLTVHVDPEAEPGTRELRLVTAQGLSNPLIFQIGTLPEKTEVQAIVQPVGRRGQDQQRPAAKAQRAGGTGPTQLTPPVVANGRIMPGEVDRYRFSARKGQRLIAAVSARELIPYLADAVPGWFQATLGIYDSAGKELAYVDDFQFSPDPVLAFEVPKDGEYVVEVKDAIYRGREDFVYRLSLGAFPFITSIFPLGAKAGASLPVDLRGWNLSTNRIVVEPSGTGGRASEMSIGLTMEDKVSNRVPFQIDDLPDCAEAEPNNDVGTAQDLTLPVVVNGRIERPGDDDVFRIKGKAGQALVMEVFARRLNSPLDSFLELTDATGRPIASNDDCEDKCSGLLTHHADSRLQVTLPTNGTYLLRLRDTQRHAGPEFGYRLRVSEPRPDFALRVVPASVTVRPGASVPLTVYAQRKDGFDQDIFIRLDDAPAGFKLSGGCVPGTAGQVRLTLTASVEPQLEPFRIHLEGMARLGGVEVVRPAVPAEDMEQAFSYHHLVPAQELQVAVIGGRGNRGAAVSVAGKMPVRIPLGGSARVQVVGARALGNLQLELSDAPEGIGIQSVEAARGGAEIVLKSDPDKTKAGMRGNLIVQAFAGRQPAGKAKAQNARRSPVGTLPAIPFEISNDETRKKDQ